MKITYIGIPNECGTKICNYLSEAHNVYLISKAQPCYELGCEFQVSKTGYVDHYFDERPCDVVIYNDIADDYTLLNQWMKAAKNKVSHFLIIHQTSLLARQDDALEIEELLCSRYIGHSSFRVSMISTPELYGSVTFPSSVKDIVKGILKYNTVEIPNDFCEIGEVLHIEDLCTYLSEYLEHIESIRSGNTYVYSGYAFSLQEFVDKLRTIYPQAEIQLPSETPSRQDAMEFTPLDGWMPKHSFMNEISEVTANIENDLNLATAKISHRAIGLLGKVALFVACFFAVELYTNFSSVASDLQYVDARLIFIAMCGVMFGKKYAVAASIMCGAGSVIQRLLNGYRWYVLFFNVNNWLPIAIYILVAVVIGTYTDKLRYALTNQK